MKVDLKTTPNKVEKAVREIVNTAAPKEKLKEKTDAYAKYLTESLGNVKKKLFQDAR